MADYRHMLSPVLPLLLVGCLLEPGASRHERQVRAYRNAFLSEVGSRLVAHRSTDDFLQEACRQRILLLGDHHRAADLHQLQLALLDALGRRGRPLTFVLEAVAPDDETDITGYLQGRLGEQELWHRTASRSPRSWLAGGDVDTDFYRQLIVLARRHGAWVRSLEPIPRPSLQQRDARMALRLEELADRDSDRLLVVVVGESHLLGRGRLLNTVRLNATALGAWPPPQLRKASQNRPASDMHQSSGGLGFFDELL